MSTTEVFLSHYHAGHDEPTAEPVSHELFVDALLVAVRQELPYELRAVDFGRGVFLVTYGSASK